MIIGYDPKTFLDTRLFLVEYNISVTWINDFSEKSFIHSCKEQERPELTIIDFVSMEENYKDILFIIKHCHSFLNSENVIILYDPSDKAQYELIRRKFDKVNVLSLLGFPYTSYSVKKRVIAFIKNNIWGCSFQNKSDETKPIEDIDLPEYPIQNAHIKIENADIEATIPALPPPLQFEETPESEVYRQYSKLKREIHDIREMVKTANWDLAAIRQKQESMIKILEEIEKRTGKHDRMTFEDVKTFVISFLSSGFVTIVEKLIASAFK